MRPRAAVSADAPGGPASIAASTAATVTSKGSKSASHHVAPAAPHPAASSPGNPVTTMSNGRPRARACWTMPARAAGSSVSMRNTPSCRSARATGRRFGHRAASQIGIPPGRAGAGRKVTSSTV